MTKTNKFGAAKPKKEKKGKKMAICPDCGANSTDLEFCSDCGGSMTSSTAPAALILQPGSPTMTCPVCSELRDSESTRFCENCRYDFVDQKPYSPPPDQVEPEPEPEDYDSPPVQIAPVQVIAPIATPVVLVPQLDSLDGCLKWELLCKVDQSLCQPGDPTPTDFADKTYPVLFDENLIGRRSDSKNIHPEIIINDPGVSRRHALLKRHPNRTLTIIDLGSENRTIINGKEIPFNTETPLKNGDELVLGCWTRVTVVGTN